MPHILQKTQMNAHYKAHAQALQGVADEIKKQGVERIVYYSTQWISVLGVSIQAKKVLKDTHVDENWYEYGALPFHFESDVTFAKAVCSAGKAKGLATALVDYEGFPIDTGSIVAQSFINPRAHIPTTHISCHVYADYDKTKQKGALIRQCIDESKKLTAVVAVTGLVMNYFTDDIDLREDRVRDEADHVWSETLLGYLKQGKETEAEAFIKTQSQGKKLDWGLKGLAFASGARGVLKSAEVLSYAPVYGTMQAAVRLS
jgi:2-aminophenol/2-amino-5-chlorophenol 1,6-dioxygenase alpha subunit